MGRNRLRVGRLALALAVVGWGSASVAVAAETAWDRAAPQSDMTALFSDPKFTRTLADAQARVIAAEAERKTAAARAERLDSRSAFADVEGRAAFRLAQRVFPELLTADLDGLDLPAGVRLDKFTSPTTAKVVDAKGDDSLLVSTTPVAAAENGKLKPLDLSLETGDDGFETARAASDVQIPERADEFLTLPEAGVGVRPDGASAVEGTEARDRVFYPEIAPDTDYVATATPRGAEFMWQLRSAAAPQRLGVDLDLPEGATVRIASALTGSRNGGVAEIVRDGKVLANISAPVALDADNFPVAARFVFADGELAVAVEHRGEDVKYPILVDPEVAEVWGWPDFAYNGCGGPVGSAGRWGYQQAGVPFTAICGNPESTSPYLAGLFVLNNVGYYTDGAYGQFIWSVPYGAHIKSAWFDGIRHLAVGTTFFAGVQGSNQWGDVDQTGADIVNGQMNSCDVSPCNPALAWHAAFGMFMVGAYNRPYQGVAGVRGVRLVLGDEDTPWTSYGPVFRLASNGAPKPRWIDDRTTGVLMDVGGHDNTLGIKRIGAVSFYTGVGVGVAGSELGCAGHRSSPCPKDYRHQSIPMNTYGSGAVPEGYTYLYPYARDVVDREGYGGAFEYFVDRSDPTIELSGELYTQRLSGNLSANPILRVDAKDGTSAGGPAGSGAKRILVRTRPVGGTTWTVQRDYVHPGNCDNCHIAQEVAIPSSLFAVQTTVRVDVEDALGHTTGTEFNVVPPFHIQVRYPENGESVTPLTPEQRAIVEAAVRRWEQIITADAPDSEVNGFPIDDLLIDVRIGHVADPADTNPGCQVAPPPPCWDYVATGGPTDTRNASNLPNHGTILIDFQNRDMPAQQLEQVLIHEIGHVLGIGTLWEERGFVLNAGTPNPSYHEPNALQQYRNLTGQQQLTGIPVEGDHPGEASNDSHWDELNLSNELMTPTLDNPAPLSRITIGALIDLGYIASYATADPWPGGSLLRRGEGGFEPSL